MIEDAVIRFRSDNEPARENVRRVQPAAASGVAVVTNIPTPYRVPVFNRIARDGRIALTVVFCAEREPDRHWDVEPFEFKSVVLRESYFNRGGRFVHNNPNVLSELHAIDPAVVITGGFNPTHLYAFGYAWRHGRKHLHWTDGTFASERDLSVAHKWLRRFVFKRSAAFIGASEGSLELFRSYGCASDKLYKAPLCVDNKRFYAARSQPRCYDLMFCGRLAPGKQPLFAIDVAEKVAALLGREVSLLVAGSGELEIRMRERAARALRVKVTFHGFATQAELPGLYASARVFLFPTLADVWGIVANEACAAGLPVVATPFAGTVEEIIRDGVNGFVRNLVISEWATVVQRLLTDARLYAEFSRNSLRLVADYTYDAAAAGVIDASLAALVQDVE